MRPAVLAVILIALGAARADAGVGPALEFGAGTGAASDDIGSSNGVFGHAAFGVQFSRVAVLLRAEGMDFRTANEAVDSPELEMRGTGLALRVELAHSRHYYVHLSTGITRRKFNGVSEVRRSCTVFGGCDAGFYREVPKYEDDAPWMSISAGLRASGRVWPAIGVELGVGPMTIDRSGNAPDEQGAIVWFALNLAVGTD
jgi:hypothetical protein